MAAKSGDWNAETWRAREAHGSWQWSNGDEALSRESNEDGESSSRRQFLALRTQQQEPGTCDLRKMPSVATWLKSRPFEDEAFHDGKELHQKDIVN